METKVSAPPECFSVEFYADEPNVRVKVDHEVCGDILLVIEAKNHNHFVVISLAEARAVREMIEDALAFEEKYDAATYRQEMGIGQ